MHDFTQSVNETKGALILSVFSCLVGAAFGSTFTLAQHVDLSLLRAIEPVTRHLPMALFLLGASLWLCGIISAAFSRSGK